MLARTVQLGILAVVLAASPARAEGDHAVALLPLDAAPKLEIYGQPVASEIARALVAGNIAVVVVGPKMAVPDRAQLIVDGNIAAGKGEAVVLTVRVRNRADGVLVATLQATAPELASIDKAAADVSSRVLPAVRERLAALAKPVEAPPPTVVAPAPVVAPPRPMLVAIGGGGAREPLRAALAAAITPWATTHHRAVVEAQPAQLTRKAASKSVKDSGHDLGMSFDILGYEVERDDKVPLATARVRVRVADGTRVLFDRIVITDTVVGDRGAADEAVARRTAREVLEILRPHLARKVSAWR